jgi:hypothetical protein
MDTYWLQCQMVATLHSLLLPCGWHKSGQIQISDLFIFLLIRSLFNDTFSVAKTI